jgi:hypothetical protein
MSDDFIAEQIEVRKLACELAIIFHTNAVNPRPKTIEFVEQLVSKTYNRPFTSRQAKVIKDIGIQYKGHRLDITYQWDGWCYTKLDS